MMELFYSSPFFFVSIFSICFIPGREREHTSAPVRGDVLTGTLYNIPADESKTFCPYRNKRRKERKQPNPTRLCGRMVDDLVDPSLCHDCNVSDRVQQ
jgi:hypothetical protein